MEYRRVRTVVSILFLVVWFVVSSTSSLTQQFEVQYSLGQTITLGSDYFSPDKTYNILIEHNNILTGYYHITNQFSYTPTATGEYYVFITEDNSTNNANISTKKGDASITDATSNNFEYENKSLDESASQNVVPEYVLYDYSLLVVVSSEKKAAKEKDSFNIGPPITIIPKVPSDSVDVPANQSDYTNQSSGQKESFDTPNDTYSPSVPDIINDSIINYDILNDTFNYTTNYLLNYTQSISEMNNSLNNSFNDSFDLIYNINDSVKFNNSVEFNNSVGFNISLNGTFVMNDTNGTNAILNNTNNTILIVTSDGRRVSAEVKFFDKNLTNSSGNVISKGLVKVKNTLVTLLISPEYIAEHNLTSPPESDSSTSPFESTPIPDPLPDNVYSVEIVPAEKPYGVLRINDMVYDPNAIIGLEELDLTNISNIRNKKLSDNQIDMLSSIQTNSDLLSNEKSGSISVLDSVSVANSVSDTVSVSDSDIDSSDDFSDDENDDIESGSFGIEGLDIVNIYAINLDGLNFTNATYTRKATGEKLLKCSEWDFNSRRCLGDWVQVRTLDPGQDYSTLLYPGDPAFAEVIYITNAWHMDEDRNVLENIYDSVRSKDDIWTTIPSDQYIRVRFEKELNSSKDITLFARSSGTNTDVYVYEFNDSVALAKFDNIHEAGYYKIFLTNLTSNQDTFDLLITGGDLEIDQVIDPIYAKVLNLTFLGTYTKSTNPCSIDNAQQMGRKLSAGFAFVSSVADDAITILNVSDPTNISCTGSYTDSSPPGSINGAQGIKLDWERDLLYVCAPASDAFSIYNISNKSSPVPLGSIATSSTPPQTADGCRDIAPMKVGDQYFVAVGAITDDYITIWNVTDPSATPQFLYGYTSGVSTVCSSDDVRTMEWDDSDQILITASYTDDDIAIFSVAGDGTLTCLDDFRDNAPPQSVDGPAGFEYDNETGLLFVAAAVDDTFIILNVSNPSSISYVSEVRDTAVLNLIDDCTVGDVRGSQSFAYCAILDTTVGANNGIAVFNVTDASNPTLLQKIDETFITDGSGCGFNLTNYVEEHDGILYALSSNDDCFYAIKVYDYFYIDPNLTLSRISPPSPTKNDTLIGYCTASDDDPLYYNYQWYLEDVLNSSGSTVSSYSAGIEINVANISKSLLFAGQNWTLSCQANDTRNVSSWVNSTTRTVVAGIPPVVNSSRITPLIANLSSILIGYCNATDAEGDNVTYNYRWYLDGAIYSFGSIYSNYTPGFEVNVANITSDLLSYGQVWNLSCQAFDGEALSLWKISDQTNVSDVTPPVVSFASNTYPLAGFTQYNYSFINVTVNEESLSSSFIDWNDSIIGWWRFNSLADFTDYSTHSYDGANENTTYTPGHLGGARHFDGDDDYVNFGDLPEMDSPGYFSISMWFKRDASMLSATNHNINNVLIAQSSSSSNDNLEIGTDGGVVEIYVDTAGTDSFSTAAGIVDDTWYNIVITYDMDDTNELKIYLDGALVQEWPTPNGALVSSASSPLTLGIARPDAADPWGDFSGTIDDVLIIDRAIDAIEVAALYNSSNGLYKNFSNLADGDYLYVAYAQDIAGNVGFAGINNFTVDTIPPIITFVNPSDPDGANVSRTYSYINITINENASLCNLNWSGTLIEMFGSSQNWYLNMSDISDGSYSYFATCNDSAGNIDYSEIRTLFLDANAPNISLADPANDYLISNYSILFNWTVNDHNETSACNLTIDGVVNQSDILIQTGTFYDVFLNITEGTHYWNVTCFDSFGNINTSETRNFTIAILPTEFNILIPINNTISLNLTPLLTWEQTVEDNFYNYTVFIDNDPSFSSPDIVLTTYQIDNTSLEVALPLNPDASYWWRVIAYDLFENMRISNDSNLYVTDTILPSIFLNYPSGFINDSSVTFNYTPFDANLFNCSLYGNFNGIFEFNQSNSSPLSGEFNYFNINLSDGVYTWNVECYDAAGSNNFSSSNMTFTLDTLMPSIDYDSSSKSAGTYPDNSIFINISASDANLDTVTIYLYNSTELINTTSLSGSSPLSVNVNFTNLPEGNYYVNATANDSLGHMNNTTTRMYVINFEATGTPILACGNIISPDKYILTGDINSTDTCLTINVDDVSIDCLGHSIIYDTLGTNTRMGITAVDGTNQRTNLTVKNCVIVKPTEIGSAGYGIMLTRYNNSRLINNTIYTNGTTNNYGIYLTTDSQGNLLENNTIYSFGTSTGNAGIYLLTGSGNNTIKNNYISTSGTTTGYGIWVSGVTRPSDNNNIILNNISTSGTSTTNYGIYLYRNVSSTNVTGNEIRTSGTSANHGIYVVATTAMVTDSNIIDSNIIDVTGSAAAVTNYGVILYSNANSNNITNNNITTHGTTANYGVYILGTAAFTANSNLIDGNNIQTIGSTNNNFGVYIATNANQNIVRQNVISTSGTSTNHGVYVNGDTIESNYNEILSNNITTTGTANANYGVHLYRNVSSNTVYGNIISTGGTTNNHGIYAVGAVGEGVYYNIIDYNVINATGSAAAITNYGIVLSTNINSNNITNNNVTTRGTTANYGIYLLGTAALSSNDNKILSNIVRTIGTTTNNYGVYLATNVNSNEVSRNDIATQGTTGNNGVYILGATTAASDSNIISSNNINATGSGATNYGVLISTNANSNVVTQNNISTFGTSTNHGVYINGDSFASTDNVVSFNNISTSGTANINYGVYLYRNVISSDIIGNIITTSGTTNNHGISALGTTSEGVDYTLIDSNIINATGNAVAISNYGLILSSNANYNNVTNNVIDTQGTTANYGVHILGAATLASNGNVIASNNISSSGTANNNYGVYLATNVNQNKVQNNSIRSVGTSTNYGVYVSGTTYLCVDNEISSNNIYSSGSLDSNFGVYLYRNVSSSNVTGNSISTIGTVNNYGIYLLGTAFYPLNSNVFESNILNVSNADRINIGVGSWNTIIKNNTIINRDYSYYDFRMSSAGINQTTFIDQYLENYTFTTSGGTIDVIKTAYGAITFLSMVNGTGTNFSEDIKIENNFAYVNSLMNGLNKSADISLYNLPTNFSSPGVYRNGIYLCDSTSNPSCYNLTSLNAGNVTFNVSGWSNYSIGEKPYDPVPVFLNSIQLPTNNSPYVTNQNYSFNITIQFTNGTTGVEFNGLNYSLTNIEENFTIEFNDLGAGIYSYYYWAYGNGTSQIYANSDLYQYTIAKATPVLTFLANGGTSNLSLTYPQLVNISASASVGMLALQKDGLDYLSNNNLDVLFGVGSYLFRANITGNANYSDIGFQYYNVTINKAASLISLTLNGSSNYINITYGQSIDLNCSIISGDSQGLLMLYNDGSLINSGYGPLGNLTLFDTPGAFNITCVYNSSQNYSSSSSEYWVTVKDDIPEITLFSPSNNTGDNDGNVTFIFSVANSSTIDNCSLIINGLINQSNSSINITVNQSFSVDTLSIGGYSWQVSCYAGGGLQGLSQSNTLAIAYTLSFDGATTNLSQFDISNIPNFTIESLGFGKIVYIDNINLSGGSNIDENVDISNGSIFVNITLEPRLNRTANLYMYYLPYQYVPTIFRDEQFCTDCTVLNYSGYPDGNLTFNVSHFTNYTARENSALKIWDDSDNESGYQVKYAYEQVKFYANYTNLTSGLSVAGAVCNISFIDYNSSMVYNVTSQLYIFNRSFNTTSTYNWSVYCNGSSSGFEILNLSDNITLQNAGILNVTLFYPFTNANVSKDKYFNFSINVSCTDGVCKNITTVLDPITSWWNASWNYRMPINLTVSSGITPGDFQVQIILNSSNVGSNFNWSQECLPNVNNSNSRIRFVNKTDSKSLPYWVQNCSVANQNMSVWVKVDNNITTSAYTIFLYYGNPTALNGSNGTATFDFFDDFQGDLSKWTRHIITGSYPAIENGYMTSGGGITTGLYGHTVLGSNATYTGFLDGVLEGNIYLTTNSIGEIGFRGNFGSNTGYKSRNDARAGQGLSHLKPPYAGWGFLASCAVSGTPVSLNTWLPFSLTVSGSSFTEAVGGQTKSCTDTQYTTAGEISLQNHYGSFTRYDNIRVRKYFSSTPIITAGAQDTLGFKGLIPMGSGSPFYTIHSNPMNSNDASCLNLLYSGESCIITWTVNATGNANTAAYWEFFSLANYTSGNSTMTVESSHINISIIDDTLPPRITNPRLNVTELNQSQSVRLNVSVVDESLISYVTATIKYPNGSSINYSMNLLSGDYYYLDFSNTLTAGLYNITYIIAGDLAGNINVSDYSNLTFYVYASPPTEFNLTSPNNASESSNLSPNLTWQQTTSNNFYNYTILISTNPTFATVNFRYYTYSITNNSTVLATPLTANTIYYWRVIVYDAFGNSENSTQDFIYITDTITPVISLGTPQNNFYVTSSFVLLNYTPSDANTLANCTLYGNFSGVWSSNESNSSILNGQQNFFNLNLSDGIYLWNVQCYDLAGNNAFAINNYTLKVDTNSPTVNLMNPLDNHTELTTNNVFFEANASDVMSTLASCSLIIDNTVKQTIYSAINNVPFNFTELVLNGDHNWSVNCTDINGLEGSSITYNLTVFVADSDPPLIDMNFPFTQGYVQSSNVSFNYTPKDATGFENCSIYIDSVLNNTSLNPANLQFNYFNISEFSEGVHNWQIICYDNSTSFNIGYSAIQNFTVDTINPVVTLNTPLTDLFISGSVAFFNFTSNDTNIDSCMLYGNFSGLFLKNSTLSSPLNNQPNNFTVQLSDGIYLWNVLCNDSSGRSSFASQNYTIKVDTISPKYYNITNYPVSTANFSPSTIYEFNITITDNIGVNNILFENNFSGIVQNQTPTNLGNNKYQFSTVGLPVGNYYYRWYMNDTNNNKNQTNIFNYTVQRAPPVLNLEFNGTDANILINQSTTINITAYITTPSSGYLELYLNGTLINNGTAPLTNITLFDVPGYFNVTVVYFGNENYTSYIKTNFVNVTDVTMPNITLINPSNNTLIGISPVIFQYSVADSSILINCSLYINNTLNQTNTTIARDTTQIFNLDMNDGSYNWRIECYDSYNNKGISATNYFAMLKTTLLNVKINLTANKSTYQQGELIPILLKTTDAFNNSISSDTRTAIIYTNITNTTAVWWNESWPYRTRINVTERNNTNTTSYQLNLSINTSRLINTGKLKDDCGDLRFADESGQTLPYHISYGCNTSSTIVWVNMDLKANKSTSIYMYYGNASFSDASNISAVYEYYDASDQLASWAAVGAAGSTAAQGLPQPSYYATSVNGNYLYRNIGLTTNMVVDFNVRSDGLGNFFFLTSSTGSGQHFRAETRGGNNAGIASATAWTSWAAPSGCANIATNTWYNFTLIIGQTTAQAYINGIACGGAYTFSNNGGYIGLVGDGLGGAYNTWWDNIRVRKYLAIPPTYSISAREDVLVAFYLNTTDIDGLKLFSHNSFTNTLGNYSIVTAASIGAARGYNYSAYELLPDSTPPMINLSHPLAGFITANGNVSFNWSIYDYSTNATCNLTVDGAVNISNIFMTNYNVTNVSVTNLNMGTHYWNVTCWDTLNNINTSVTRNFTVDRTPPTINLNSPENTYNTSNTSIIFNWTVVDDYSMNLSCYILIDNINVTGNITSLNNTPQNFTVNGILPGLHYWNVSCTDEVGNYNTSLSRSFVLLSGPESISISLLNNQNTIINWSAVSGADSYNIYFTENYTEGFSGTPNVTGLTELNYTDSTANLTYRRFYKVSAIRGAIEAFSNVNVGKYDKNLEDGFNLVSSPFILHTNELKNSTNTGYSFNVNDSCVVSLWSYDQSTGFKRTDWVSGYFVPATGSEDFISLDRFKGYWIETNTTCELTFVGVVPYNNESIPLVDGFTLVSWLDVEDKTLPTDYGPILFNTTPDNSINVIDKFNAATQGFEITVHYMDGASAWGWFPSFDNPAFTEINPVEGYYFESNPTSTWNHNPGDN